MNIYNRLPIYKLFSLLLLLFILPGYMPPPAEKNSWTSLFDGKDLEGWNTYLGQRYDPATDKNTGEAIGLNRDPQHVFTVVKEDGRPAIRISGEIAGAISTKKEYENYHLQLDFKWGAIKWPPKKDKKRDSGLLYHSVGPYGADWGAWMRSQEFQIEEGSCGDYWGCAGGTFDVQSAKNEKGDWVYDPAGTLRTFSGDSPAGRHCVKSKDGEKPSGQWNTIDLYCHGDTSMHVINGVVTMVLLHSRQSDKGTLSPLTKGSIQVQSEGAEVFYRNIRIRPLEKMPAL